MFIKKTHKLILLALLVSAALFVSTFFLREYISNYLLKLNLEDLELPGEGSRVLIFAPHNDDEVLGAGMLINKVLKAKGQVKVVLVTNGDGYKNAIAFDYLNLNPKPSDYIQFGYKRQKETIKALEVLGLSKENMIFLGYPDGGISYLWNSNWDKSNPLTSIYTQTNTSPYYNSYTMNAVYSGESLADDIVQIISQYKPTHVIYPHPNDRHPDHWATNCFVKYALVKCGYSPQSEWLYLVHRGDWPTPMRKEFRMFLVPPAKLANAGTLWEALAMSDEDIAKKAEAISVYKSQMRTLKPLMTAFERKNELLGEYPDLKLPSLGREDSVIEPDNSNLAIIDPLQDALNLKISRSADISSIHVELSSSGNLHIFLLTDRKIDKKLKYRINLLLMKNGITARYDLESVNNKITLRPLSKHSITDKDGISLDAKGNMLHLVLPSGMVENVDHIYLNGSTSTEDHLIDKTAWRMLDK